MVKKGQWPSSIERQVACNPDTAEIEKSLRCPDDVSNPFLTEVHITKAADITPYGQRVNSH